MRHDDSGIPSWYVEREQALDHLFSHVFPILRRDGFEGSPLYERLPDGRIRGHAIIAMTLDGAETAVLVPYTLRGDADLVEFASQPGRGHYERQRFYLRGGGRTYVDKGFGPDGLPGSDRVRGDEAAAVALFFANVLGANAHRPPNNWLTYGRYAAGSPPRVIGMHEVPSVVRIADIADPRARKQAHQEAALAAQWFTRAFAFFRGSIIDASEEPRWIVAGDHEGRVTVRIDTHMGGDNPADKVQAAFSLDREREALAYAQAMSETVAGGIVKVKPGAEVFRPDLATPSTDDDTIRLQTIRLGKLVEHVATLVPAAAFKPVAAVAAYCAETRYGQFDRSNWERLWKVAADALGDTGTFVSGTLPLADRKAAIRFHQAVLTLDNVCAPSSATDLEVSTERAVPDERVQSPVDLDATGQAIKGMAELLSMGGDPFLATWAAARDAVDAFREWPDAARADAMVDALRPLADATPETFPSAPAAGRWAMKGRAVLRAELAKLVAASDAEVSPRL